MASSETQVPSFDRLMWPAICALKQMGGSASHHELLDKVIEIAKISEDVQGVAHCQGRSKKEPPGRSKRGPLQTGQGATLFAFWGRLERSPARPEAERLGRSGSRPQNAAAKPPSPLAYFSRSAARFCLLDFSR